MPTASASMVEKLAADAKVMSDALDKMKAALAKIKKPSSLAELDKLADLFGKLDPRIQKFVRKLAEAPPVYPDEDEYKLARKLLTAVMANLPKVAKLVEADKKLAAAGPLTFKIDPEAVKELAKFKGNAGDLLQALAMVARGEPGRSGPKQDGIDKYSHIHIGGKAKMNLLFRPAKSLVLGYLGFHLQKDAPKEEKEAIQNVASRSGAPKNFYVDDDGYGPA